MSGRWDRFCWFGVRPIQEDGSLEVAPSGIDIDMLIATLEALMIERLEPPQNRRQGDRFNALEFIQLIDLIWSVAGCSRRSRQRCLRTRKESLTPHLD